jgi:hypothetical protein
MKLRCKWLSIFYRLLTSKYSFLRLLNSKVIMQHHPVICLQLLLFQSDPYSLQATKLQILLSMQYFLNLPQLFTIFSTISRKYPVVKIFG